MENKSEKVASPFCKETVLADAIKCKHCKSTIGREKPDHGGVCPYCKEEINESAIKCKHCMSMLIEKSSSGVGYGSGPLSRLTAAVDDNVGGIYGQECFYYCYDATRDWNPGMSRKDAHEKCERDCGVSMPPQPPDYYDVMIALRPVLEAFLARPRR